ncbi:MAG TPA: HlyD family secretion protein [Bryobacteraceae bacterium]|jgi:membrane fusion protein (multidrug efflux system)
MATVTDKETHEQVSTSRGVGTYIKWIVVLAVLVGIGVEGYRIWEEMQRVESTDDAQIDGTISPVSARIAGNVTEVLVADQQAVKAGDVLVQLDRKDLEVALARAQADLADAQAALEGARSDIPVASVSSTSTLSGAKSSRDDAAVAVDVAEQQLGAARARLNVVQANVRVAQANLTKASQDVERYRPLAAREEIARQTFDQALAAEQAARATVDAQQAAVAEAQQNISVAEKSVEQARAKLRQADSTVEAASSGPQQVKSTEARAQAAAARVAQKRAEVEQAQLNLTYTTITAPVAGIVGRKAVDVGQNIAPGQQVMSIVAVDDIWITANFKETQLKDMKVGQSADIEVDANGRTYSGRVERIAGASGAKFSLLPPENATGNYVRVVQRIPVRIDLDPNQNNDHALRPGMSVTPKVHIR